MKTKNTRKITLSFLESQWACDDGINYWKSLDSQKRENPLWLINHAIHSNNKDVILYANWVITRIMSSKNAMKYALYSAEIELKKLKKHKIGEDFFLTAIQSLENSIKVNSLENRKSAEAKSEIIQKYANRYMSTSADKVASAIFSGSCDRHYTVAAFSSISAFHKERDSKKRAIEMLEYGLELLK